MPLPETAGAFFVVGVVATRASEWGKELGMLPFAVFLNLGETSWKPSGAAVLVRSSFGLKEILDSRINILLDF